MNGRVYDPLIARFISADPFVPDPFETQSFNRYSYVNNRPLSFTDPSGYSPDPDNDDPPVLPCAFNPMCPDPTRPGPGFPVFPGFPDFTPGYIWPSDFGGQLIIPPYRTAVGGSGIVDKAVPARPNDRGHVARDPLAGRSVKGARPSWDELGWADKWTYHTSGVDRYEYETQPPEVISQRVVEAGMLAEAQVGGGGAAGAGTAAALAGAKLLRSYMARSAARALASPRASLLSRASDPKLRNRIEALYRENARVGNGGTADALRYEMRTGKLLSPSGHTQKV